MVVALIKICFSNLSIGYKLAPFMKMYQAVRLRCVLF